MRMGTEAASRRRVVHSSCGRLTSTTQSFVVLLRSSPIGAGNEASSSLVTEPSKSHEVGKQYLILKNLLLVSLPAWVAPANPRVLLGRLLPSVVQ